MGEGGKERGVASADLPQPHYGTFQGVSNYPPPPPPPHPQPAINFPQPVPPPGASEPYANAYQAVPVAFKSREDHRKQLELEEARKADVVRDYSTNNVPDSIVIKLGMRLHRRDQHPIGILKNAIYSYFDTMYSNKLDKFDDLCPIVSVKQLWSHDT
ncbi:unnamed protein product [Camellia sinensis]